MRSIVRFVKKYWLPLAILVFVFAFILLDYLSNVLATSNETVGNLIYNMITKLFNM